MGFLYPPSVGSLPNLLANGHCAIVQEDVLRNLANNTAAYISNDMWWARNILGTNGVVSSSYNGQSVEYPFQRLSPYAYISTAPTAAQTNGCELYIQNGWNNYVSPGYLSYPQTTYTLKMRVRGIGNVTQIGITPFYNAGAATAKPQTALASAPEQTFSVVTAALVSTNAAFSEVTATFNLSTALTAFETTRYNMIGFRVRPLAVSSGNLYDLGNGVQCGRTQLNPGSTAGIYTFYGGSFLTDLQQCQHFFEKSYDVYTNPGTATGVGAATTTNSNNPGTNAKSSVTFLPKIVVPTITTYDFAGNAAKVSSFDAGNARTDNRGTSYGIEFQGPSSFSVNCSDQAASYGYQWVADSRPA